MFDVPLAKGNRVALGIGVSHQYTNIRHNNKFIIDNLANTSIYALKDSLDVFTKSVFSGNSLSIPVELRFRMAGWKHVKLHIGGKVGYQLNTLSKSVSSVDGHQEVYKLYGSPDENKFIYSAHVRLGLRNWALYASYNFNPIFMNSNSTKLNAVQMGLSISLF
jgi:hypothetical protein